MRVLRRLRPYFYREEILANRKPRCQALLLCSMLDLDARLEELVSESSRV